MRRDRHHRLITTNRSTNNHFYHLIYDQSYWSYYSCSILQFAVQTLLSVWVLSCCHSLILILMIRGFIRLLSWAMDCKYVLFDHTRLMFVIFHDSQTMETWPHSGDVPCLSHHAVSSFHHVHQSTRCYAIFEARGWWAHSTTEIHVNFPIKII